MRIVNYKEYKSLEGVMVGNSPWRTIDQKQINKFTDAIQDNQWIHVDKERAANERPYRSRIVHRYLTLALIPYLWKQIALLQNVSLKINYGIVDLRFGMPVKVNAEVSLLTTIKSAYNLLGLIRVIFGERFVFKDSARPAYTHDVLFFYQFN
ncbi:MaoC family dehydratase [Chryseobacterium pennae]|uniref:MaoC family dehydratase n=1 Tax=Chryseobacterium pennae TaxID=2258962 RepID=A0A3D9C1G0_9FLAO|nr:MaoC/PaaZ C-terminal domain-containing protein [Chryseobacterium pennae]REC59366.1 MaoC family dehydratase [Chryseobacterium pennae]